MSDVFETMMDAEAQRDDQVRLITILGPLVDRAESALELDFLAALWAQRPVGMFDYLDNQVSIGSYRADFVLYYEQPPRLLRTIRAARLVVEVDGHDYHERTKQQAARDKSRDRFLLGEGFRVARFTGSEIYGDPFGCAQEAWNLEARIWHEGAPT